MSVNAKAIALSAAELVSGDREATHGDKVVNHTKIAVLWSAYLKCRFPGWGFQLEALDAANLMEILKIARRLTGDHNLDDYVDAAGYAAVAGEIAERDL